MKYTKNKYGAATGVVLTIDEWEQCEDELRTLHAEHGRLELVAAECDRMISQCCGDKVGTRFCEAYGCADLAEIRDIARFDAISSSENPSKRK